MPNLHLLCGNKSPHHRHAWLATGHPMTINGDVTCPGVEPRTVMMHPADYRKPSGEFTGGECVEETCVDFGKIVSPERALEHTRKTGCRMEATYVVRYSMRAQ